MIWCDWGELAREIEALRRVAEGREIMVLEGSVVRLDVEQLRLRLKLLQNCAERLRSSENICVVLVDSKCVAVPRQLLFEEALSGRWE